MSLGRIGNLIFLAKKLTSHHFGAFLFIDGKVVTRLLVAVISYYGLSLTTSRRARTR